MIVADGGNTGRVRILPEAGVGAGMAKVERAEAKRVNVMKNFII